MHIFEITSVASLVTLLGLVGSQSCGEPTEGPAVAEAPALEAPAPMAELVAVAQDDFPTASATSTISGTMKCKGDVPAPKKMLIQGDAFCEELWPEGAVKDSLLINEDGQIKNVFVYIKKGVEQWDHKVPEAPVTLLQKGCFYHPHVFGIMVGQELLVSSFDDTTHNVHLFAISNNGFNITQKKDSKAKKKFTKAEVMVEFKCDIHSHMNAKCGILDHPFYAVSAADGSFKLPKLPAGTYTLEAVHEDLGRQSQEITITDGETKAVEFTFEAKKKRRGRRR